MQETDGASRFRDLTLEGFTTKLASAEPVPGGGSASAVAASLGAALVSMVASLSTGRPKYAEHEELLAWAIASGDRLADRFLALADEDAVAYAGFAAALKLPKDTEEQVATRKAALSAAARRASEVPLACVQACLELAGVAEALAGRSNVNASSDLNVASLLADAAAKGAAANVLVNLPAIGDPSFEGDTMILVDDLLRDVEAATASTREVVASGERRDAIAPYDPA